ncbi:MAG: hypothetical protein IPI23_00965 [Bacteroidetes bacterium]|nr:hypothetical protein [Bacteroidota bacterium]
MIRAKDEVQIHYYELDYPRVDISNYIDTAYRAAYDLDIINFIESFLSYSESEIFDYNTEDPEDVKKLEYYSTLWIDKVFYSKIESIIDLYKIPHKPGTICLILLILKKYDKWLKYKLKLKKKIHDLTPDEHRKFELGRFLHTLLDEVRYGLKIKSIELNVNSKKIKYNHGDYILKHIAKCVRTYYNNDKGNKLFEDLTFPNPDFKLFKNETEEPFNFRKQEEKLRNFSISVISYLISSANTTENKSFIINQLLGVNNILDYQYHIHNRRERDNKKPQIIEKISKLATKYKSKPIECIKELWL